MTMEEVACHGNLRRAFEKVASNDGAPGPDRQSIEEVEAHLGEILPPLSRALLEGSYRPGMVRRVWIPKSGGGQRGLGIPNVVDRTVQQAVHQVLSPHYEPTFHESSHGFRPGRSCHTAIAEAKGYLEEGYEWAVDLDLEKFFDRVPHDRLMARLGQRVKDARLLRLIRQMLKAKVVMPDGVVVSTEEGTPQGGPLSPLLSNIVLDELDRELSQRGHRFVRYADDCNVYVRSERSGKRVMASVVRFIERRLRLKVNAAKSAVARPEERHFVGFRLRREPLTGEVEVLLSRRSRDRIGEKVRELTPRNWGQSLSDCIRRVNAYLLGWIGFFWICTATEVQTLRIIDAHIRRRLRALMLRHWKRRRTIVRRLIRLGVRPAVAWRGIHKEHRSWWALSHCAPVDRGLRNAYFAERGLVSLAVRWAELCPRSSSPQHQWSRCGDDCGWQHRRWTTGDVPGRQRPEEPDVWPTSPVPREGPLGDRGPLLDRIECMQRPRQRLAPPVRRNGPVLGSCSSSVAARRSTGLVSASDGRSLDQLAPAGSSREEWNSRRRFSHGGAEVGSLPLGE
ncbi:MAG: group II intron reverse transcriptase/maturase [Deltaproteobacteria bacterium]|nr:group II intron reverse transcriptase/maturase [Deltaproteobacteria bacterium]